jgi:hypothetical protein
MSAKKILLLLFLALAVVSVRAQGGLTYYPSNYVRVLSRSDGDFYLSYSWPGSAERGRYCVYDLMGRRIQEGSFPIKQGRAEERISLPSSGDGIYCLIINNSSSQCILSRKILVYKK